MGTNGVIHTVDRLMFPAPIFEKEIAPPAVEETDAEAEEFVKLLQENVG